ncbi:MAG: choice-of-anchor Q domain-containing protein, partial [bacterium]
MKKILGVMGIFFVLGANVAFGADLYVPGSYTTIQSAIDAAITGDTVWVADGIYTGTGNKDLIWSGKHITVRSINGAEYCIIDCQNSGRGFYFFNTGQNTNDVIMGFTIKNGYVSGNWPYNCGAGIYCSFSSPSITNNIITGNNTSNGFGGGIYYYQSSPSITNNIITRNTAAGGGGIYGDMSSFPSTITNNIITGNTSAWHGGGIECYKCSSSITNNIITGNTAYSYDEWGIYGDGGGIYCYQSSSSITNNIITGNIANRGGGIYCDSASSIGYNDSWSNSPQNYDGISDQTGINGNISADPQFIEGGDYHLQASSPCIDAGSNTAPAIPSTDKDGNLRIVKGIVDMGAYEFQDTPSSTSILVTPTAGIVGTIVTVAGSGFGPTELIQIDFGTTRTMATVFSNAGGTFTALFTVNVQPYGMTTVKATGLNSGGQAENVFCLLPNIIFVAPMEGTVGTIVTVRGSGYGASEVIAISFGTTRTISLAVDDYAGKFDTTFTINTQPYGTT